MKQTMLIFLIICLRVTAYSQVIGDSSFANFRSFIKSYISAMQEKRNDTLMIFFPEQPVVLEKTYSTGGSGYAVKVERADNSDRIDSNTLREKYVINSRYSFDDFLNFMIKDGVKPSLAEVRGSFAFVYMPVADWQQFYLDYLIGYDTLMIFPQIEILRFHNKRVSHQRYLLECCYTKEKKFFIKKVIFVRNNTIELTN